jgi:phosphoribosylamine--glycine ligase/phosphoribosylformylglycinamidine cyclo-ligase
VPALFQLVREVVTQLDTFELYRTLNMGIGMVLVCAADDVVAVQHSIDESTWVIGQLVATSNLEQRVHLR